MKSYLICPTFYLVDKGVDPKSTRVQACISMVADLVFDSLRQGGDRFHYAVDWRNPDSEPWIGWDERYAEPHIVNLSDPQELKALIQRSVDPFATGSATVIRSIATCRAVTFGWDGQALLCLRHEDPVPTSPDPSLVEVTERKEYLSQCDYFDGYLPEVMRDSAMR